MNPILRILLGLVVMAIGVLVIWKTDAIQGFFGPIPWADEKLGGGGTRSFYKLIGLGICFLGILIATNFVADLLESLVDLFVK